MISLGYPYSRIQSLPIPRDAPKLGSAHIILTQNTTEQEKEEKQSDGRKGQVLHPFTHGVASPERLWRAAPGAPHLRSSPSRWQILFLCITGETNTEKIQENIKSANSRKYFLYCLGFGFDVSYSFLEKMALDNGGIPRRIYLDSDATLQLQVRWRWWQ